MAISGGARNCVRMEVKDGRLTVGRQEMTQIASDDEAAILARLARGEVVYVDVYGGLPARIIKGWGPK